MKKKNEWHIFMNGFMDWAREEFPEPLSTHFTYEMLENIITYVAERSETSEEFILQMTSIVPEVTEEEWRNWINV